MNIQTIRSFVSRSRLYQGWLRLWYNSEHLPRVTTLLQTEFAESDLYRQANCLHAAGYNEAAVIVGSITIRRSLRQILAACPGVYPCDLPKKASSQGQCATYEIAYFLYDKGIVSLPLRRALGSFQKKVNRVASGIKLRPTKAQELMNTVNVLRPQLEQAMGRVKLTLPLLERSDKQQAPSFILIKAAHQLAEDLTLALEGWHRRVYSESSSTPKDPLAVLTDLRARGLISRKEYKLCCKVYDSPGEIGPGQAKLLQWLIGEAIAQATTKRRKLSDNERFMIGTMIGRGASLEEVNDRFGIQVTENGTGSLGDFPLVEDAIIDSASKGGATCQEE